MTEADVYRCPSCGAPADPQSGACAYCGAKLEPVRCPWCFAWTDAKTGKCPRCGAGAEPPAPDAKPLVCPTCRRPGLSTRVLGDARLSGCGHCGGLWADVVSFKRLCEERDEQTAYLGAGTPLGSAGPVGDPTTQAIVYRPCPVCAQLMNRFNFAGSSGVILDACKPHGVWFDPDELRRVILFIRRGGLDDARAQQERDLDEKRRELQRAIEDAESAPTAAGYGMAPGPAAVRAAGALLDHLF
ncbi:MAG: zf-TFIIB domain-containing protein [Elusimicrobia bacterium]|nr:zf-TFIIB domain-containing protein [Elusimicrobiota bacterium]